MEWNSRVHWVKFSVSLRLIESSMELSRSPSRYQNKSTRRLSLAVYRSGWSEWVKYKFWAGSVVDAARKCVGFFFTPAFRIPLTRSAGMFAFIVYTHDAVRLTCLRSLLHFPYMKSLIPLIDASDYYTAKAAYTRQTMFVTFSLVSAVVPLERILVLLLTKDATFNFTTFSSIYTIFGWATKDFNWLHFFGWLRKVRTRWFSQVAIFD